MLLGHRRHTINLCDRRLQRIHQSLCFEEVFGTAGRLTEMIVAGMTDMQIVG